MCVHLAFEVSPVNYFVTLVVHRYSLPTVNKSRSYKSSYMYCVSLVVLLTVNSFVFHPKIYISYFEIFRASKLNDPAFWNWKQVKIIFQEFRKSIREKSG